MKSIDEIMDEFHQQIFIDEMPSSYDAAKIYKQTIEQLLKVTPNDPAEIEYLKDSLNLIKQTGVQLGVSEHGVVSYPHIEHCSEELIFINCSDDDIDKKIQRFKTLLETLDNIENFELKAEYGVVPIYMAIRLNNMRESIDYLIEKLNKDKSNS